MSEFTSSDSPVTHLSITIPSSQIKFEGLEQLRIARLRKQQRREPKQTDVLIGPAPAPRKNRKQKLEPRKRIGKVVIKLRNGKKLVVKKKRKQTGGQRSKTTQRPVLVTTKAVIPPKPRLSFPSSVSLPPIRVSTPAPAPAPAPATAPAQKTENIFQRFNSIPIGKRYCVVKA